MQFPWPSRKERFAQLFGIPLVEGYAMSECVPITCNRPGAIRVGSIGLAVEGVELRVVDFSGKPVADGIVGELSVRSKALFREYWNEPASTAAALQDGRLLTGDVVHRDAEGYVWFERRRKEINHPRRVEYFTPRSGGSHLSAPRDSGSRSHWST